MGEGFWVVVVKLEARGAAWCGEVEVVRVFIVWMGALTGGLFWAGFTDDGRGGGLWSEAEIHSWGWFWVCGSREGAK